MKLFLNILLFGSVICAFYLVHYAYKKRKMPGAKYFLLLLITAIVYNSGYFFEINANDHQTAKLWFDIEHIAIPMQHYFLLLLSLEYTNINKRWFKIISTIGLSHPILYYLVFYTPGLSNLYIKSYQFVDRGSFHVLIFQYGILYYLIVLSGTVIGIISSIAYINGYMKSSNFQRNSYLIMMAATVFPWVAVYIGALKLGYGVDFFPFSTIIAGGLYVIGIFQYKIFHTIPIATEIVFRHTKEAIILLDMEQIIVDANIAAIKIYPELENCKKNIPLSDFVTRHSELKELILNKETFLFEAEISEELRYFNVVVGKIQIDNKLDIGKIIQIFDITAESLEKKKMKKMVSSAIEQVETSEVSFLQAQISPHFINNSLSVIASMITRAPNEAKVLIADLGEYLANSYYFDNKSYMVNLEKEIEIVNTYVNIEKARFQERLQFHIIGEEIPNIKVPRLIIQPLVENAIRHGILKKIVGGNVWLKIQRDSQFIYFEIKDDGIGMAEEVRKSLLNEEGVRKGIGVINIHRRLLKYYGEGLLIISEPGKGSTISFRIPNGEICEAKELRNDQCNCYR
ncbi:sensor histidine kinase [Anaerosacchariphilus polymeriproducens]|nr:histidine kinase N-terminal 7TM domain-containing protein [Anaerosacchariphilus polymeriproducens]